MAFLGTFLQSVGWNICSYFDRENKLWFLIELIMSILSFVTLPIEALKIVYKEGYSFKFSLFSLLLGIALCVFAYLKSIYPELRFEKEK